MPASWALVMQRWLVYVFGTSLVSQLGWLVGLDRVELWFVVR